MNFSEESLALDSKKASLTNERLKHIHVSLERPHSVKKRSQPE